MSDWIKCSERMPPGNVEVLVVEVAKTFNWTFTAISIAQWDTDGTFAMRAAGRRQTRRPR